VQELAPTGASVAEVPGRKGDTEAGKEGGGGSSLLDKERTPWRARSGGGTCPSCMGDFARPPCSVPTFSFLKDGDQSRAVATQPQPWLRGHPTC
jgi:hypothetical protein